MNGPTLQVQMLGQFTLRYGDRTISDSDDRSRRVWSLLAYMLYNHGRSFAQEELIHLYWSNNEKSADPGNALKSIFHRIRTALDKLQPGLGRLLIRRKAGRYFWNNAMPLSLDIEDFEAHFHAAEAVALCRRAIHIEPYQEDLYEHLMRGLLRTGDMKGAMSVYEEMSEQLFAHFGVMPSETLRTLYRQATRTVNDRTLTMDEVCSQLEEPAPHGGAMVCEYDFFKILYRAEARSIARNGHSANICLLSVSDKDGEMLARRSLDPAMNNLQVLVQNNLRRGDVIARCSISQYIILLPQANYENSRMVADRLVSAFYRRYPHSPARLRYTVQPLA